jgi:hypothetical protein
MRLYSGNALFFDKINGERSTSLHRHFALLLPSVYPNKP